MNKENKNIDPIKHIEDMVQEIHDTANLHTKPILKRYPLSFALITTFGFASILHGFDLILDKINILHNNPIILILIGMILLLITGTVYKQLDKKL